MKGSKKLPFYKDYSKASWPKMTEFGSQLQSAKSKQRANLEPHYNCTMQDKTRKNI